jgi:hypothetical protein
VNVAWLGRAASTIDVEQVRPEKRDGDEDRHRQVSR